MGVFEMVVAIVLIGTVSDMYRARLKARSSRAEDRERLSQLAGRLEALEQRLINVESLVVEQEKHAEFDRALNE